MADFSDARGKVTRLVLVAGLAIAVGRFVTYLDVVDSIDVEFAAALTWWGIFAAGLGLLVLGALGQADDEAQEADRSWVSALVGLVLLALMPAGPMAMDFSSMFSRMFGG